MKPSLRTMKRLPALGALLLTTSALDALPPLIPREVLFGNPDKTSPQLSPDGARLAYLAPDTNNVLNVWVRTLGEKDDQVVTADKKRGIRMYFWQPDSEHVLYLQDADGDENWHLYQTSLKSRNTRDLTPFQGVQAQVVAVDPNFPDQILVGLNLENRQLHDVYRIQLKTGAVELDTKNPGDVSGWTADNALQVRVASVFKPDGGTELRVRDDAKAPWRPFKKWGADETFGGVAAITPDNKGAWIISSVDANAARLMEFDLAAGTGKVVAEDADYDVSGLLTHPTKRTLEAVSFVRARSEWQILDPAIRRDFGFLLHTMDGDMEVLSRDLADAKWIVAFVVDNGPVYYYLYERGKLRQELLFTNRSRLRKFELSKLTDAPERHFMVLSAEIGGKNIRNEHFFCAWKKCELPEAKIKCKVKALKNGFEIELSTRKPAFYVSLFAEGISGEFSDNCFTVLSGRPVKVSFEPCMKTTAEAFKKALSIKHLRESYSFSGK